MVSYFFLFYCCDGVSLCLCGTGLLTGPSFIPQVIHEWICSSSGMILTGETKGFGEKPVPVPICPPQIPYGLTCLQTWASMVRSQWLTAWAMAQPYDIPCVEMNVAYRQQRFWEVHHLPYTLPWMVEIACPWDNYSVFPPFNPQSLKANAELVSPNFQWLLPHTCLMYYLFMVIFILFSVLCSMVELDVTSLNNVYTHKMTLILCFLYWNEFCFTVSCFVHNRCLYFSDGNTDTMLYAVLWLPSRFTQLYVYVITLIMACMFMIVMLCEHMCSKFRHKLRRIVST
jgi:hypothetical protein